MPPVRHAKFPNRGQLLTICNELGVAERPTKIHGTLDLPGCTPRSAPRSQRIPHKLASRLCSKPAAVPKLGDGSKAGRQGAGSSLRRIRSKFSRIDPEQNRLCRIADIGRESEGRSCSENSPPDAPSDHGTARPNEFPADAHGPAAGYIRRNCFVPAPATAVGAHAPIKCRSR